MSNITKKTLLAVIIFGMSVAGPSYSFWRKGYAPGADYLNLVQARNYALAGTYKSESALSVFVSSEQAVTEGVTTGIPNPLTPIIYGYLFSWFGFRPDLPFFLSIGLFGVFNVLLFFLALRLLGLLPGFFAGIVSALMPSMTVGALYGGFYEWAIVFFGVALWAYLGSRKGPFVASITRVGLAGVFFALAALARNAFAISFLPFFFFDAWHHRSLKRSAVFLLPFLIIFGTTLTPFSWLGVPNGYTTSISQPFQQIGHFFNDPYSYHFDRDAFKQKVLSDPKLFDRVGISYAIHFGYPVSFAQRLSVFRDSFAFYVSDTLSFTSTGGILIWFLGAIGAVWLWKNQRTLTILFGVWFLLWFSFLIYTRTANWDHSIEIIFLIASIVGAGCARMVTMLRQEGFISRVTVVAIALLVIGHFTAANKWRLFDAYRSSRVTQGIEIIDAVNRAEVRSGAVIAVGTRPEVAAMVNYGTDRSVVFFHPDTVRSLGDVQLKAAFGRFNIIYAAGFEEKELHRARQAGVVVIQ